MGIKQDLLDTVIILHAQWLESNGNVGKRADLSGWDLKMQNLPGVDLRQAKLTGVNFERANLRGAKFDKADLSQSNLSYAIMSGCSFFSANLSRATADGTDLSDADLSEACLDFASFRYAQGARLQLSHVRGYNVNFTHCLLTHAKLIEVELENAIFNSADLTNSVIQNSTMSGADLTNAVLTDVVLKDTLCDEVLVNSNERLFSTPDEEIKLTKQDVSKAISLHKKGKNIGEIAKIMGHKRAVIRNNIEAILLEYDMDVARRLHKQGKTLTSISNTVGQPKEQIKYFLENSVEAAAAELQTRNAHKMARVMRIMGYSLIFVSVATLAMMMFAGLADMIFSFLHKLSLGLGLLWYATFFWGAIVVAIAGVGFLFGSNRLLEKTLIIRTGFEDFLSNGKSTTQIIKGE